MTYAGRTMKTTMWRFSTSIPQIGTSLLLIAKSGMRNDQMTILSALSSRTTYHTRSEYIHAPPLFLCLVSFFSHVGESWNRCSVVGVGIN